MASVSVRLFSSAVLHLFFCCTWRLACSQNNTLTVTPTTDEDATCVAIDGDAVPWCTELGYNMTSVPNFRNHQSQEEAFAELDDFRQLIETRCSGGLLHFLCSVYAPLCYVSPLATVYVLPPCQNLCWEVRNSCIAWFMVFGQEWPEHLECSKFPQFGEACFGPEDPSDLQLPPNAPMVSFTPHLPSATQSIYNAVATVISSPTASLLPTASSFSTASSLADASLTPKPSVLPTERLEPDSSNIVQGNFVIFLTLTILSVSFVMYVY